MLRTTAILLMVLLSQSCAIIPSSYEMAVMGNSIQDKDASIKKINKEYVDGSYYQGEAVSGIPEGEGVLKLANGDIYKGKFSKGKMSGNGALTTKIAGTFKGIFDNDVLVTGEWISSDGIIVKGKFGYNKAVEGVMIIDNKVTYKGSMYFSPVTGYYREGKGEYVDKYGDKYVGFFKKNNRNGEFLKVSKQIEYFEIYNNGQLTWHALSPTYLKSLNSNCKISAGYTNWVVTKGKCRNGLLEGQGAATRVDSKAIAFGKFQGGELKNGEIFDLNGTNYKGSFLGLRPHGNNVDEFVGAKLTYSGGFLNGIRHGQGVCTDTHAKRYCEYSNGRRVDAVYLAENQLINLRSIADQYQQSVSRELSVEIEAKRQEINQEHKSRVKQLENQMDNAYTINFATAVAQGTVYNASGNTAAMDSAIRAQVEKTNRFKEQIEQEKQNHRRQMQQKETEWTQWKKAEMEKKQGGFDRYFSQWSDSARQECNSIPDRLWSNNICISENGLLDSEVHDLNRIVNSQMKIKHGANRAYASSTGMLDSYARKSEKSWNSQINKAAEAERSRKSTSAVFSGAYDTMNSQITDTKIEIIKVNETYNPKPKRNLVVSNDDQMDDGEKDNENMNTEVGSSSGKNKNTSTNTPINKHPVKAHTYVDECESKQVKLQQECVVECRSSSTQDKYDLAGCENGCYGKFEKMCNGQKGDPSYSPRAIAE